MFTRGYLNIELQAGCSTRSCLETGLKMSGDVGRKFVVSMHFGGALRIILLCVSYLSCKENVMLTILIYELYAIATSDFEVARAYLNLKSSSKLVKGILIATRELHKVADS